MQQLKLLVLVANPSKPSVRLTALEEPIITNTENGMKNHPRFIIKFLKKENINLIYYHNL